MIQSITYKEKEYTPRHRVRPVLVSNEAQRHWVRPVLVSNEVYPHSATLLGVSNG